MSNGNVPSSVNPAANPVPTIFPTEGLIVHEDYVTVSDSTTVRFNLSGLDYFKTPSLVIKEVTWQQDGLNFLTFHMDQQRIEGFANHQLWFWLTCLEADILNKSHRLRHLIESHGHTKSTRLIDSKGRLRLSIGTNLSWVTSKGRELSDEKLCELFPCGDSVIVSMRLKPSYALFSRRSGWDIVLDVEKMILESEVMEVVTETEVTPTDEERIRQKIDDIIEILYGAKKQEQRENLTPQ